MNNRLMEYYMMRDGRNPYGSRGGYITPRDPRRRDRAMEEDMARGRGGSGRDYAYDVNDYARRRNSRGQYMRDRSMYPFEVSGEFEMYNNGYDGHHYDPYMEEMMMYDMARGRGRDMRYDYGESFPREELDYWTKKLMKEVDEKDKQLLSKENILMKAEQSGIKFDKFTPEEFYATTLMAFTDYSKTLGTANIDIYLKLAKDFLCDEDSELKYGEKLFAYYNFVVCPE